VKQTPSYLRKKGGGFNGLYNLLFIATLHNHMCKDANLRMWTKKTNRQTRSCTSSVGSVNGSVNICNCNANSCNDAMCVDKEEQMERSVRGQAAHFSEYM